MSNCPTYEKTQVKQRGGAHGEKSNWLQKVLPYIAAPMITGTLAIARKGPTK